MGKMKDVFKFSLEKDGSAHLTPNELNTLMVDIYEKGFHDGLDNDHAEIVTIGACTMPGSGEYARAKVQSKCASVEGPSPSETLRTLIQELADELHKRRRD